MIAELRIRGIGVIEEAVIDFAPGLTVVTGETGAGKTMVLTGLAMLRGAKSDPGVVRLDAGQAQVDGIWRLSKPVPSALADALDETGVEPEPSGPGEAELVLGRSLAAEGRSRAFAGGRVVPAAVLERVTDTLLAVHGQADQVRLSDARRQRALLDRYGRLDPLREQYAAAFAAWRTAAAEHEALLSRRQDLDREATLLRLGLAEIDEVDPQEAEDELLKEQAGVLANATDLVEQLERAHELLNGDQACAMSVLTSAARELERASALDPGLALVREQLARAMDEVQAVSGEIAGRASSMPADGARLAEVEDRRQRIGQLKRKYGPTLEEVLAWRADAEATVLRADSADDRLAALAASLAPLESAATVLAGQLSRARREAGARLAAQVTGELRALAMSDAEVEIAVESAPGPAGFTADGADTVAFLLRPHSGAPFRPVGQGASGGELSRVMLAIEVCLADASPVPTFVFDEVDAGIGGKVAVEVGSRLSRLAQQSQVIVVTHLPQVAAFADRHVVVRKQTDGSVTSSSVEVVEDLARVEELVRMLSGLEGSASGAKHAAELLAAAAAAKAQPAGAADGGSGRATPKRTKRRA